MTGASAVGPRAGLPRSLYVVVAALAVAAVTAVAVSLWLAISGPAPVWWQFAACAALFGMVSFAWLTMRVGSQLVLLGWTEAAVVVGLALLPPAWVVPAIALGCIPKFVRHWDQPVKGIYNASMDTFAAAVVVLIVGSLSGLPVDLARPGDIAALALGAVVYSQLTEIGTAVVVGLSQQRSPFGVYRNGLGIKLISQVGNVAAALLAVGLVRVDPRVMLVLPPLLFCLKQAYEARLRGRDERESWQGLLEATRSLADLDERVVLARATAEATRLFSADRAEVELAKGRLVRGDEHGVGYDGPVAEAPADEAGATVERPVGPDAARLGLLRLCFATPVSLTDREQAMLGAVAAELHSALVNAGRHATAQHEATHDPLTNLLNRAGLQVQGRAARPRPPPPGWTPRSCSSTSAGSGRSWTPSGTQPVTPCWCTPRAGWRPRCCPASWRPGSRATSSRCCCPSSPTRRRPRIGPTRCSARSPARPSSAAPRSA